MTEYMATLPGIVDSVAEDGTTAFAIALAKRDPALIQVFLASEIWDERNKKLAKDAVHELRQSSELVDTLFKQCLVNALGACVEHGTCDDHEQDEL